MFMIFILIQIKFDEILEIYINNGENIGKHMRI
jgi:hypothetical protein